MQLIHRIYTCILDNLIYHLIFYIRKKKLNALQDYIGVLLNHTLCLKININKINFYNIKNLYLCI